MALINAIFGLVTLGLYIISPSPDRETLLKRELKYWDKEYIRITKLSPEGQEQRQEYRKNLTFYFNRRTAILAELEKY